MLPGATVTVHDGNSNTFPVLATGTTNSLGVYVQSITVAKTYYYEITRTRFVTGTGTVVAACSGTSNTNVSVTLTAASGYGCGGPFSCVQEPLATTLYVTDPVLGTVTLGYYSGAANPTYNILSPCWYGCTTVTGSFWNNLCVPATVAIPVYFRYASGQIQLHVNVCNTGTGGAASVVAFSGSNGGTICSGTPCPSPGTACGYQNASFVDVAFSTGISETCYPSAYARSCSIDFSAKRVNALQRIYGSGSQTFSVSE